MIQSTIKKKKPENEKMKVSTKKKEKSLDTEKKNPEIQLNMKEMIQRLEPERNVNKEEKKQVEESRVRKIARRLEDVEKKTQSGKEGYGHLKLMLNKSTPRPGAVVKKTDEKTNRESSKPLDFYFDTTPVGTLRQKVGTPFWEK